MSNIDSNELVEFISLKSSKSIDGHSTKSPIDEHVIGQLVESSMGPEITATAREIIDSSNPSIVDNAANSLAESNNSYQMIREAIHICHTSQSNAHAVTDTCAPNKRPKTPDPPMAAPTSFSLFDMLDQQNGKFGMYTRITADMIIKAYQQVNDDAMPDDNHDCKSCLELLEKADDIEDLSPDPETWEQIRRILYDGLVSTHDKTSSIETQSRFLQVHKSLHKICQRGSANTKTQCWDLAQNVVGLILSLSKDFEEKSDEWEADISTMKKYMNLYWNAIQQLLNALSHLALDYITSCVGDERQIERMVLGICLVMVNDYAACTIAAIEPLASSFEVWARFVPPKKMLNIVKCSGLGGVVLRRCFQGTGDSAKKLADILNKIDGNSSTALADIDHAHFLQSLSLLRTMLYQCGSSLLVVNTIAQQFANLGDSSIEGVEGMVEGKSASSFLTSNGVACVDSIHHLLIQVEGDKKPHSKRDFVHPPIETVFKPFHCTLADKDLNELPHVKWLCTSSLEICNKLK